MKIEDLKYVTGSVSPGEPACIRFYGYISEGMTARFNEEFLWLQEVVQPSKIIVSINSEGGSVLYGMRTYSIIQQCPIEVETVIEGLAASMASVVWAAGTRSYMRDYSILMIHNPFIADSESSSPDVQQTVNAFQKQIEMIYHKRFGIKMSTVKEIMDGKEGCDGTYFDAKEAVAAGIIPADHVLKTSKQICEKVKNQLEGVAEASKIQKIMSSVNTEVDEFKPNVVATSIPNQNKTQKSNQKKIMNEEQNFAFSSVCAQLGFEKGSEVADVVTRINALKDAEAKLKEATQALNALQIQKEGVDAQLTNVQNELTSVKNELQTYKDAEQAQKDAAVESMVDAAIADGKIGAESKEKWITMAKNNLDLVTETLNSIPKRDQISKEIANDPANVENAKNGKSKTEIELEKQVEAAVGKDFEFKTLG